MFHWLPDRTGIPNQNSGISTSSTAISFRIPGIVRHAQIEYSPMNGHVSGRPSEHRNKNVSAQRGCLCRCRSIASRKQVTSIGSDCALSQ